jgi:hypothetical protein
MNTKRKSLIYVLFCITIFSLVQQLQKANAQSGKIIGWGSQVVGEHKVLFKESIWRP